MLKGHTNGYLRFWWFFSKATTMATYGSDDSSQRPQQWVHTVLMILLKGHNNGYIWFWWFFSQATTMVTYCSDDSSQRPQQWLHMVLMILLKGHNNGYIWFWWFFSKATTMVTYGSDDSVCLIVVWTVDPVWVFKHIKLKDKSKRVPNDFEWRSGWDLKTLAHSPLEMFWMASPEY